MRLLELFIDDEDVDEIFQISLVENPAIESDFVFFDKEEVKFEKVNKEERLVMGPILIPNKKILRVDGMGEPYQVFFKPETVKKLSQMYLERKYQDQVNIEHDDNKKVEDVTLVESWIVESHESDKSKLYGLNLPVGTWAGTFKINNDDVWQEYVKTGKVKGFSVEGLFSQKLAELNKVDLEDLIEEIEEGEAEFLLSQIKAIIKQDKRTKSGKRVELESYSDYPDGVKNNAKRGIELNENQNNKCGTQVGKVRAQQLAKGEPISIETIKRMHSYLSRAEVYYDENKTTECGTISYLLWGGKAALGWSRNKLRELGILEENAEPSVTQTYPGEPASGSIAPELLVEEGELDVYGYETTHFYICPGAYGTFNHLVNEMDIQDDDLKDMLRAAALIADAVFMIEKNVLEVEKATPEQHERAVVLVSMFKDIIRTVDERVGMDHDISYMDGHIQLIEKYL